MSLPSRRQRGPRRLARVLPGMVAAWMETAPHRAMARVRHAAGNRLQPVPARQCRAEARYRAQQPLRVWHQRLAQQRANGRFLHHLSRVHHQHAVGDLRHHADIVRDEDHRHVRVPLQSADQVQDLRLNGHVQRGRRLVGDQQARAAGQCHRDHHALAHTAGKVVRIAGQPTARLRDADQVQQFHRPLARRRRRHILVLGQRLGDLRAHAMHRIERGHRLQEDHAKLAAAHLAHRMFRQRQQVDDPAIRLV